MTAAPPVTGDQRDAVLDGNRAVHAVEADYYDAVHAEIFNFWQQRQLARELARCQALLPAASLRVLDIGCGTGNIARRLWRRGHSVDGVDLSAPMLSRFRAKQREDERLRLHCTDADTFLQSAQDYHLVAFSSVLHHLPDYEATLARAARALVPGGVLFVTHEPLPANTLRTPGAMQRMVSTSSSFVDQVRQRLEGIRMPPIDYGLSDVHAVEGISPEAVLAVAAGVGMRTVFVRRYRPERCGVAAFLNDVVFNAPPTQFSLIAQRGRRASRGGGRDA